LAHADETERPFGCGSDDMSADWDLPPDRRFTHVTQLMR